MSRIILIICIMCGTYNLSFCNAKLYFNLYINLNIVGLSDQNVYYNVTTLDGRQIIKNTSLSESKNEIIIPLLTDSYELKEWRRWPAAEELKISSNYSVVRLSLFNLKRNGNSTVENVYISTEDLYLKTHAEAAGKTYLAPWYHIIYLGGDVEFIGAEDFDMNVEKPIMQDYSDAKGVSPPDNIIINVPFNMNINFSEDHVIDATSFKPKKYNGQYSGSYKVFEYIK
ncbi:hypothetical protein LA56_849 [Francisella philomiragia]|uniref:hypothetical protein n=1 Tax=Francisella philomiragia TaxID=28110 RepID=UPI0005A5691F|nr:hypothetical protein [Francisella philomiragia]AJI55166.1 hypothetical protein LA56_849 [Francisella philomiragia]MBK2253808.1 hypothetical protein [Francisella philomiragia]